MRFGQKHPVLVRPLLLSAAIIVTLLLAGCTTLRQVAQVSLTAIEGILSDASMQLLVQMGAQLQKDAKLGDLVTRFANADLGLLKKELLAVNRIGKDLGIPIEPPIHLTPAQQQQVQAIIDDVQAHWINEYGWLESSAPLGPKAFYDNDNPALFTAIYLWELNRLGMLNEPLRTQWFNAIKTQEAKNQLQPGLYDRYPIIFRSPTGYTMNFSHDESLGLLVLDFLNGYKFGYARDQRTFGNTHGFNFPNAAWSAFNMFNTPVYDRNGKLVPPYELFIQTQFYGSQVEDIQRAGNGTAPSLGSDIIMCAGLISMISNDAVNAVLSASIHKGESDTLDGCLYQFNLLLAHKYPSGQTINGYHVTSKEPIVTLLTMGFGPNKHPIAQLAQFFP